jgi:hypothetical protein
MTLLGFQDSNYLDFFDVVLTLAHATMSADVSSFRKARPFAVGIQELTNLA